MLSYIGWQCACVYIIMISQLALTLAVENYASHWQSSSGWHDSPRGCDNHQSYSHELDVTIPSHLANPPVPTITTFTLPQYLVLHTFDLACLLVLFVICDV